MYRSPRKISVRRYHELVNTGSTNSNKVRRKSNIHLRRESPREDHILINVTLSSFILLLYFCCFFFVEHNHIAIIFRLFSAIQWLIVQLYCLAPEYFKLFFFFNLKMRFYVPTLSSFLYTIRIFLVFTYYVNYKYRICPGVARLQTHDLVIDNLCCFAYNTTKNVCERTK